jgi:hypothetical protein
MIKPRGTLVGAAVAAVAAIAILTGLGVHATAGAGTDTDVAAPGLHVPTTLTVPTVVAQPPASPIEPVGGTQPGGNPNGNLEGVNGGPGGLPNAGSGPAETSQAMAELLIALGIAGLAFVGTGAAINSRRG